MAPIEPGLACDAEGSHGVEILAPVICIWIVYAKADSELTNQQYAKHGLVYESSSHSISSRVSNRTLLAAWYLSKDCSYTIVASGRTSCNSDESDLRQFSAIAPGLSHKPPARQSRVGMVGEWFEDTHRYVISSFLLTRGTKRARRFSTGVLPALDKRNAQYSHTIPDAAGIYANGTTVCQSAADITALGAN
jgi:hypothetical protein